VLDVQTDPRSVISHWHQLIEGLNASPAAFYDAVQSGLTTRDVPDATMTRVEYQEAGLMSARRVYLHVARGRQVIDVCAAPFGTGFFVSAWLAETRIEFPALVRMLVVVGYFVAFYLTIDTFGAILGPLMFLGGIVGGMWLIQANRDVNGNNEDYVLAMPVLGRMYERFFKANTYFALDTALMFRDAVHNAVIDAVDGLTNQHGLRALTEFERRPVSRTLVSEPKR
jgi:hypothetical protein